MPHSSGGGSHGGGYHSSGGGSSRSSSSSSSSYDSDYNYTPSVTISRDYFQGSYRYVYYDSKGKYHNYYTSGVPEAANLSTTIGVLLVYTLIAAPILWFLFTVGLYAPRKLDVNSYNSAIVVEDHTNLLNQADLEPALQKFLDATGVSPSVEVVLNSEWEDYYTDLETFALSEYLRMFDDEKHWLVVLSYPDDYATTGFVDWSWEGMIGDDCYPAFNSDSEDLFTTTIQKHLLRSTPEDLTGHLADAYQEYSEIGMKIQYEIEYLICAGLIIALYLFCCIYYINDYRAHKQLEKAVPAATNAPEFTCEYCGTRYVAGTLLNCPNCGAPIPAQNNEAYKKRRRTRTAQ